MVMLPSLKRGRLTAFIDRHQVGWDVAGAVLTVAYVVLAFRQEMATPAENVALWALGVVFLTEFVARFLDAPSRLEYLRHHWLDLVTAVPVPGIPGLRFLRLLRLLRFLKIGMVIREILLRRGWDGAGLLWPTMFLFWVGSALALWLVEHDAPGATIRTFPDALFASFITASTLGFAKHALQPATETGQMISAIIVFLALGLWGFASSRITQLWLQGQTAREQEELQKLHQDLRTLRAEIGALTEFLRAGSKPDVVAPDSSLHAVHERVGENAPTLDAAAPR
ncbi:MAG: two pore domain potassium channel family protein [Candidatus Dormibacteraeota bacterium]|nr:two pore domain potassium channel family protein [Candidatus Dormibacteraeota bacterium]